MKLDPRTSIGHVHLKVSNLERAVSFYRDVLGFELTTTMGNQAAFLSAGGYHHHIGLNTWQSEGGSSAPLNATGLYHFAILVPSRRELARCLKSLNDNKWPIQGATDHGVSHALYLNDPDQNGIEIYCDMPREQWPQNAQGGLEMYSRALDLDALLAEFT